MNKKIKISLMIGFVILGTVLAITLGTQKEILPIGAALPKLKYVSLNDSGYISIKDKPLIIMFFKPDCPHCEYELELMNTRYNEIKGVDIYCITTEKKFIQDTVSSKWNNLFRMENAVFSSVNEEEYKNKLGINVTPVFYFFNREGKLTNKIIGETKFERLLESIKENDGSKHLSVP
jgi:thioredoxin-related protein